VSEFFKESLALSANGIPRCPFPSTTPTAIHVFCDSSNVASAAVAYLVHSDGEAPTSNFLISKSKVVPISFPAGREVDLRIPRKELVACLLGARLGCRVAQALSIPLSHVHFWSDSLIALCWIKKPPANVLFVRNRCEAIQKLSDPDSWRHVPGSENPADIPTRSISVPETAQVACGFMDLLGSVAPPVRGLHALCSNLMKSLTSTLMSFALELKPFHSSM